MQTVEALFADYASYHQTKGNKVFHRLGIPMIMFSLIGMLTHVTLFDVGTIRLDAAMVLIALSSAYYFIVEWRLGIAMIAVSIVFYFVSAAIPLLLNAILFVLGWIFQFIGHKVYEHKNPAFFRNFVHLLIGPLWILNDVIPVVKSGATNRAA
ncbi:MAG TPA: Mpo1-like protein [Thermoanaerobaculia bacterium]|nr:Mpo1-like protein [Thermoanaerobaculia bacterium]